MCDGRAHPATDASMMLGAGVRVRILQRSSTRVVSLTKLTRATVVSSTVPLRRSPSADFKAVSSEGLIPRDDLASHPPVKAGMIGDTQDRGHNAAVRGHSWDGQQVDQTSQGRTDVNERQR